MMADYRQKLKTGPSRLLAGFGAVAAREKPENWREVRREMEQVMVEKVNKEDGKA